MNFVENLTVKLDISIRSLAYFLGIHHSLLARFDTAERMLPSMALPEAMELHNLAAAARPAADPLPNEQHYAVEQKAAANGWEAQHRLNCRLGGWRGRW